MVRSFFDSSSFVFRTSAISPPKLTEIRDYNPIGVMLLTTKIDRYIFLWSFPINIFHH